MSEIAGAGRCLNCGTPLHGPFCAGCGQRAVPPNPTVRELTGDAWHELSGYDGRIMATIRGLLRPGFLTSEYIAGRRAHYLPPVRVYLIVSVIYFVVAAAAPNLGDDDAAGGVRIVVNRSTGEPLSEEERAAMRDDLDDAPWFVRPLLVALSADPDAFRARVFTIMPRVFFGLLPVFAAVVAMFYRRRPFPTALVFAVHLHAFAFVAFTISEAVKFTGSVAFAATVGGLIAVLFTVYALRSVKAVFGGTWPWTLVKAAGIGMVYLVLSFPAFVIILVWASLT